MLGRGDKVQPGIVVGLVAMLHLAALGLMLATEVDLVAKLIFLLFWALLNFFWLTMFRRPSVAAILSLELVAALIVLSQFKHDKLWMTADFVDVMIVDHDTSAFLLAAFPSLRLP
ncbi:MAG: LTA synthase family protein, partial [Pseudolabrys sp.]